MILNTEHLIQVPGGQVWTEIFYAEATRLKTPIIFLHGGPGSCHDRLKWSLWELAKNRPVIFYDQLGSGKSELPAEQYTNTELWQIPRFVAELEHIINYYNLSALHLVGTSWGSSLALEYLLTVNNNRVKSITLGSPLINTAMWIEDANFLKSQMPADIYQTMITCEVSNTTDSPEYQRATAYFDNQHVLRRDKLTSEQLSFIESVKGRFNLHAYLYMWGPSEFHATGTLLSYDRFNDLSKINIPTLFLCGEFDEATPSTVAKFHAKVSNSKMHVFNNCSHQAFFENKLEYQQVLLNFLDAQLE